WFTALAVSRWAWAALQRVHCPQGHPVLTLRNCSSSPSEITICAHNRRRTGWHSRPNQFGGIAPTISRQTVFSSLSNTPKGSGRPCPGMSGTTFSALIDFRPRDIQVNLRLLYEKSCLADYAV